MSELVTVLRCSFCGKLRICEAGNYHPWCMHCPSDVFDWPNAIEEVSIEEAFKLLQTDN